MVDTGPTKFKPRKRNVYGVFSLSSVFSWLVRVCDKPLRVGLPIPNESAPSGILRLCSTTKLMASNLNYQVY